MTPTAEIAIQNNMKYIWPDLNSPMSYKNSDVGVIMMTAKIQYLNIRFLLGERVLPLPYFVKSKIS